jgi:hypothetical protein
MSINYLDDMECNFVVMTKRLLFIIQYLFVLTFFYSKILKTQIEIGLISISKYQLVTVTTKIFSAFFY